jgi:hypothetical protein
MSSRFMNHHGDQVTPVLTRIQARDGKATELGKTGYGLYRVICG